MHTSMPGLLHTRIALSGPLRVAGETHALSFWFISKAEAMDALALGNMIYSSLVVHPGKWMVEWTWKRRVRVAVGAVAFTCGDGLFF